MLHARLDQPGGYSLLLVHPVWRRCLDWLGSLPASAPAGRHELDGSDLFALIMEYDTVPRDEARFESHLERVDLQYTLEGEEGIDWIPRSALTPDGPFGDDVQFWLPPAAPFSQLVNAPGCFSIFYPEDAHRPKVRCGSARVRKLVIKARLALFE